MKPHKLGSESWQETICSLVATLFLSSFKTPKSHWSSMQKERTAVWQCMADCRLWLCTKERAALIKSWWSTCHMAECLSQPHACHSGRVNTLATKFCPENTRVSFVPYLHQNRAACSCSPCLHLQPATGPRGGTRKSAAEWVGCTVRMPHHLSRRTLDYPELLKHF